MIVTAGRQERNTVLCMNLAGKPQSRGNTSQKFNLDTARIYSLGQNRSERQATA